MTEGRLVALEEKYATVADRRYRFFVRGGRAFSLLEVLVVMAVMALLLGLGVPALSSLRTAGGFTKEVQQLADTLSFARSHALSKGRPVEVGIESVNDGIYLVVGEHAGGSFHPVMKTSLLGRARVESMTPASGFPLIQNGQSQTFSRVIQFNSRGEARIRPDGVDREVTLQILPNINGQTPESLRDNRVDIVIHGLSGGVSLVRGGSATAP